MAKISLRAYNREIEGLIDHNQLDEAIAHCQHVLKIHPKYLETYRLLGKAYLEAHRYAEAADIFQRVLNSVPDDFVAHLGMSLIGDEQKDLNAAIWHMERAFEIQPSNPALQGELRRLYARRDGMEPHKIRLTRGALAQMYAKGEQYEQAVAEIRSVLAEDANRPDLQVLLARVYFRAGQKVEATEMCTTLLKKLPYCQDANRIMVEILPGTDRAETAQVYRHRVNALDPYSAFATGSVFGVVNVADAAVTLEKFEWEPSSSVPAWKEASRLGLDAGAVRQAQPDWLTGAESAAPASEAVAEAPAAPADPEDIPDWMRTAGWGPSDGQAEEVPLAFEEPQVHTSDLAHADIPDWLKSMAPPGAFNEKPNAEPKPASQPPVEADLDFLRNLGVPDLKIEQETVPPPAPAPAVPPTLPGKLSGLSAKLAASRAAPAPGPEPVASHDDEPPTQPMPMPQNLPGDVSDWLSVLGQDNSVASASPQPSEDFPNWLKDTGELAPEPDLFPATPKPAPAPAPASADDSLPDWLITGALAEAGKSAGPSMSGDEPLSPMAQGPGVTSAEQDDALAWLESLAAKQGAKPEELITQPAERLDQAPDWVGKVEETPTPIAHPAAAAAPAPSQDFAFSADEQPLGDLSPLVSGPGTTDSEQDDALAWLESLAAKQGAKPEELITQPETRLDQPPDWVDKVEEPAQPPASALPPVEPAIADLRGQDDSMKWLESIAADEAAAPAATSDKAAGAVPEWVRQVEEADELPTASPDETLSWLNNLAAGEQATESTGSGQEDDTLSWLKTLATSDGEPAQAPEPTPEPASAAMPSEDISSWLQQLDDAEPSAPASPVEELRAQPAPAADALGDVPEWLRDLEEPGAPVAGQSDVPEWLRTETGDQVPPQPVPESRWEPEEEDEAPVPVPPPASFVVEPPRPPAPVPASTEVPTEPIPAPEPQSKPAPEAPAASKPRPAGQAASLKDSGILEKAQTDLARGELETAMQEYTKLVKRGKLLDEVIFDLRESTYRHPVDVVIWQTLGDAYMRANRLQEALDAYTKAEELLR